MATYPVTGAYTSRQTTCAGALSTLVSLDTDGDDAFEYRFLLDESGSVLHGCDGPCEGPIDGEIPLPRRVMLEGLTVTPEEYGLRRHDVACRGIADPRHRMGRIDVSPVHFPGLDDVIHVEVPLLRVGAFNGMFGTDNPAGMGMASALLVPDDQREEVQGDLRISTGGTVVAGGGHHFADANLALRDVWEFHPWTITWERTATLVTGHTYSAAQSFVDLDGDPAVLFIGGVGTNLRAVVRSEVYRHGRPGTEVHTMTRPRAFPGVATVRDRADRAIVVLAGCAEATWYDVYQRDYEFFFPLGKPAGCPSPGEPGFCTLDPSAVMVEGRCQGGVAALPGGKIWFGTGVTDDDELSSLAYVFDASADGDYGAPVASVQTPVRTAATVVLHDDIVALFGGSTSEPGAGTGASDRWVAFHPENGTLAQGAMRERRALFTATPLLDGRVLLAGGLGEGFPFLRSVEIFQRGNLESGGLSEYLPRAGTLTCSGAGCERLALPRAGHAATRIAGSATWLEGAVVIAGGHPGAADVPELFVPAYDCDGQQPVNRFDGRPVPDVALCDRLRDPAPLTDPRDP